MTVSGEELGPSDTKKGEEGASLFSLVTLRSTLGCPLPGWPFIDQPLCVFLGHNRHDVHIFAAELAVAKRDGAIGKSKEGVILAHADVAARVPLRAALTNDDVAGARLLAAKELHAQALAFTVATVAAGTACFFMCHDELLPESRKPVITWPWGPSWLRP